MPAVWDRSPALATSWGRTLRDDAAAGWGKYSIVYEFVSREKREERFIPHEEEAHDAASWTGRILPQLRHAPCSPAVGRRIWPAVQ
jgi:hypothetical protein